MKFHWGKVIGGAMQFDIGSFSMGQGEQRQTFRRWIKHKIAGLYGVSFGHDRFIGVIRFESSYEDRERIK